MSNDELPTEAYDGHLNASENSAAKVSQGSGSRRGTPGSFAHFRLLEKLGSGAFGTVYRAFDTRLDREVAVKVPTKRVLADVELRSRFEREARAAAAVQHANICPIFEVGEHQNIPFYSMALIRGGSLRQVMGRQSFWEPKQVLGLMKKLANALAAAHEAGLVHRDLKPENILIDDRGQPVIADFGLAKQRNADQTKLTATGLVMGTPAYMAPEQVKGAESSPASDVFSLGIIFYEILCGTRPFEGDQQQVMRKIAASDWMPPPPQSLRNDISKELSDLVMRCLSKDPEYRLTSMQHLLAEIRNVSRTLSNESQRPAELPTDPRVESLIESLANLGTPQHSKVVPLSMWIAGSVLTAAIVLIGFFAFFQTDYGKVRLQLNIDTTDPAITVSIDGRLVDVASLSQELELPAGPHELIVMRNGVEIQQYRFEVIAGATTVQDFGPAPMMATKPKSIEAAKAWLQAGAHVTVLPEGATRVPTPSATRVTIREEALLPKEDFRLTGIFLPANTNIPSDVWTTLRDLENLETLQVEDASSLSREVQLLIGQTSSLKELILPRLEVDGEALGGQGGLRGLQLLDLRGASFNDQQTTEILWRGLGSLKQLIASNSDLSLDKVPTDAMPLLEQLEVSATSTSDLAADWLAAHPLLTSLNIARCNVTGDLFERWAGFTKLLTLTIDQCSITDSDLEPLLAEDSSKQLSLVGTYVTEAMVKRLQQRWTNGKVVWDPGQARSLDQEIAKAVTEIGGTVQWSGDVRLGEDLAARGAGPGPGITREALTGIDLQAAERRWASGEWLPLIARLPALETLALRGVPISDSELLLINKCRKLKSLDVALTDVSAAGIAQVNGIQSLKSLSLDGAMFSEAVGKAFANTELEALTIISKPGAATKSLAALQLMPKLKKLRLDDIPLRQLLDALPSGLLALEELQCNIATDTDVESLTVWTSLTSLRLSGPQVTDNSLNSLRNLSRLEELDLSNTNVQGVKFDSMKGLPLQRLSLNTVPLSGDGVLAIAALPKLVHLHLRGTAVDNVSLESLAKLRDLQVLDVVDTWTTRGGRDRFRSLKPQCELLPSDDAPLDVTQIETLLKWIFAEEGRIVVELVDGSTKRITDPSELPPSNYVVVGVDLSTSPAGITDEDFVRLAMLQELRSLSLYGPACTDRALAQLQELTQLESLTLDKVQVTDRGLRYLLACTQLRQLRIAGANLTDQSRDVLSMLVRLESLQLNDAGFSSEILTSLTGLTELEKLDVSFPIRGQSRAVAQMPGLEHLVFTGCNDLTEEDFNELSRLRNVRQLTIRHCRLKDEARTSLGGLRNISMLSLQDVLLSASDLRRLSGNSQLNHLALKNIPLGQEELQALLRLEKLRALTLEASGLDEASELALRKWCEKRRIKLVVAD